jgi:hypothetical protein
MRHGAQPNAGEVRPGSPEGDAPSAAVGTLDRRTTARRWLGLLVSALLVAGVLVAVLALAGIAVPRARRHRRARGGGTYGR